jgi:hypothetical protein
VPLVANSFVVKREVEFPLVGIPDTLPESVVNDRLFTLVDGMLPIELRRGVVEGVVGND